MTSRGGRGARVLWTAAALLLLLLPILPMTPAQGVGDPWWGPSDRANPTSGWAVRVPLVVENRGDADLIEPFVAADIDFGSLLVEAGWTNQTVGAKTLARGFTLDVASIRVVRYNPGFVTGPIDGSSTQPIPHTWYAAPFEGRKANPSDPHGTVLFQIADGLAPRQKAYFYVYANPLEYGKTAPPVESLSARAPLDAFLWGTPGTTFYGYEPEQFGQNNRLLVYPVDSFGPAPRVELAVYELSRFVPAPSTSAYPNPQTGPFAVFNPPTGKAFRITSTVPVFVASARDTDGQPMVSSSDAHGFAPGVSGSFADSRFRLAPQSTLGSWTATLIAAGSGAVTVTSSNGGSVRLSPANPVQTISLPPQIVSSLQGDGDFLVALGSLAVSASQPLAATQVPARSGGPEGISFFAPLVSDGGYVRLCTKEKAAIRVVSLQSSKTQILPEGDVSSTPPGYVDPRQICPATALPATTPAHTYEAYSTAEERFLVPGAPVPFRLVVGSVNRAAPGLERNSHQPYGGLNGTDYQVQGRTALFGHYNDTAVTIFEEKTRDGVKVVTNRTVSLARDQFLPIDVAADGTGGMRIVGNKPFAAAPMGPAYTMVGGSPSTWGYARYIPGRPATPDVTLGALEFRGPLVDLRSDTEAGRFGRLTTGPGSPASYRLSVLNLGRWMGGEGLPDTVTVTCTTPVGWTVEGCGKEFQLASGAAERLNVVVTPAVEDVNTTRAILVEARSKAGGVVAIFKLNVYVEVRYGVEMWFDVEGGRKTIDPAIGLDPGQQHRYSIVLKNTGSTVDTFAVGPEREAAEGWTQELLLGDEPVTQVRLEGGESVILQFLVKAPNTETAAQNLVAILAESVTSARAKAIVNTATRIRPKVDLVLTLDPQTQLAEPNQTATFNVTARNKGNDVFRVLFLEDSVLPKGWNATLGQREIDLDPNVNFTFPLRITPPTDARAGDLATLKLKAEIDTGGSGRVVGDEISAVVVVRRIHLLGTAATLDAQALPGDTLRFVLPVVNLGNGQDSVEILDGAVDALRQEGESNVGEPLEGWRVALETPEVRLPVNETGELPLRIDVPAGTPPGLYNLTFTTRLSREAVQNLSIPVDVKRLARVGLEGADAVESTPGRLVQLAYTAVNEGNVEGVFTFAASAPAGWNASFAPASARLAPGERLAVALTLNATRATADGAYTIDLSTALPDDAPTTQALGVRIARPELFIGNVETTGALRSGELIVVSATVGNRGDIVAENVSVALVVDGRTVDQTVLARVPVGSNAVASLSWVATQSRGDVQVVVDPADDLAQADRGESAATVSFGSRLVPAPGLAWLAVGLLAALAARRRWSA